MENGNHHYLDKLEPETPPSLRYNRIVMIDRALALEMRDPNSGQTGGPETKIRHQYVLAGGQVWRRVLPPESTSASTEDNNTKWEPWTNQQHDSPRTPVHDYAEAARGIHVAVLRRLRMYSDTEEFVIRGEYVEASSKIDVRVVMGPVTGSWWDVATPPCPDCSGAITWNEAGRVPGARLCVNCLSEFTVETES